MSKVPPMKDCELSCEQLKVPFLKTVEEIIPDMWKKVKKNWWESVVSAFDVLKYFSIDFSWLLHSLVLLMAGLEWSIFDLPSYLGVAHPN